MFMAFGYLIALLGYLSAKEYDLHCADIKDYIIPCTDLMCCLLMFEVCLPFQENHVGQHHPGRPNSFLVPYMYVPHTSLLMVMLPTDTIYLYSLSTQGKMALCIVPSIVATAIKG